ncbi:YqcC family protein [Gammaproteobacteria bacterium]|nr:YqcC family protein [Gammaproteobacteria bacterium]
MTNRSAESTAEIVCALTDLAGELHRLSYWQAHPPSTAALASTMPFAADTLSCPEWLQWMCIPRLYALLDAGGQLPYPSVIHVQFDMWATEACAERGDLDALLQSLDQLLNDHLVVS